MNLNILLFSGVAKLDLRVVDADSDRNVGKYLRHGRDHGEHVEAVVVESVSEVDDARDDPELEDDEHHVKAVRVGVQLGSTAV